MTSIDPVAFEAMMSLHFPQPEVVYCHVYQDGNLHWSGVEPTPQERQQVEQIIVERQKTGYVITLER